MTFCSLKGAHCLGDVGHWTQVFPVRVTAKRPPGPSLRGQAVSTCCLSEGPFRKCLPTRPAKEGGGAPVCRGPGVLLVLGVSTPAHPGTHPLTVVLENIVHSQIFPAPFPSPSRRATSSVAETGNNETDLATWKNVQEKNIGKD